MKITRAHRDSHYTALSNELLRDGRLSFKARGLLAYILSQPPDWQTDAVRLAATGPDGRVAILSALKEIEAAGYLRRTRQQDPQTGRWSTACEISEVRFPASGVTSANTVSPQVAPEAGFPNAGEPDAGKPAAKQKNHTNNPPNPPQAGGRRRKRRACNPQAPGPLSDACRHGEGKDCHVRWCNCPHHQRSAA